jgi:hypothetical protein
MRAPTPLIPRRLNRSGLYSRTRSAVCTLFRVRLPQGPRIPGILGPPVEPPPWPPPNPPPPRANASWLGSIRAPAISTRRAVNIFLRVTFLSCCNGALRSTPLWPISWAPFSKPLLFVMVVSFSVGVMRALTPRSLRRLAWKGPLFPARDQRLVTLPCSAAAERRWHMPRRLIFPLHKAPQLARPPRGRGAKPRTSLHRDALDQSASHPRRRVAQARP